MAKISHPNWSGKRSKVSEKSGNIEKVIEWQPCYRSRVCCVLAHNTHFIHCFVLVQPRKTGNHPNMTEKLLTGM